MEKQIRKDVMKVLMDAAQNAVGRNFTDEEKGDFRKWLAWRLEPLCSGSALFLYEDGSGNIDKSFSIETKAGTLTAAECHPDADGIAIMLSPKGYDCEIDAAYVEVKSEELCEDSEESPEDVCVYTYDDPHCEDYQHRGVIRRKAVVEAMKEV